jgi:type IV pilus assembly protein PilA
MQYLRASLRTQQKENFMLNQRGFTIVELMIVVAVIGVLAAISVPLYNDYISRSKVSEAIQLTAGTRIPMQEFLGTWGRWPAIATIGAKTRGNYVSSIASGSIDDNTYFVEALMKGDPGQKGVYGKRLRIVYKVDTREWVCTTVGTANPMPAEYLPTACK